MQASHSRYRRICSKRRSTMRACSDRGATRTTAGGAQCTSNGIGVPIHLHKVGSVRTVSRVAFIVINLETDSRAMVRFYNKRGPAEQWIKEGKQAVKNEAAELLPWVRVPRGAADRE